MLANVPRIIDYSITVDNLRAFLNKKPFWSSSSSNNISKMQINDSYTLDFNVYSVLILPQNSKLFAIRVSHLRDSNSEQKRDSDSELVLE